jgi:hypothetical protein
MVLPNQLADASEPPERECEPARTLVARNCRGPISERNKTTMNQPVTTLKTLGALAILAFAAGCANTQSKENALAASGFKVITPSTSAQEAKLKALPPNKVALIQKGGKPFYVFPDVAHNQAYVGGPKQYQAYRALRAQQRVADENLEAAEMYRDSSMNWGGWGGWGGMGGYGFY